MSKTLPLILLNPNKTDFSLNDLEIEYFKDAKKNILRKYYNLTIKSIWNSVLSNLKRRVEIYGTYEFINNLKEEDKNIYFQNTYTLSEKLSLLNPIALIKNSFELGIINEKTYTVLKFFYWFTKNNPHESLSYEEVISIVTLLDKNLFSIKIDSKPSIKDIVHNIKNNNIPKVVLNKQDENIIKESKSDFSQKTNSKKVKKADLYIMQHTQQIPKRRKSDFIESNQNMRRRKEDWINSLQSSTPKRRKEDFEKQTPKRRKNDWIDSSQEFTPRRRKDDWFKDSEPKRRKEDFQKQTPKRRKDDY